MWNCPACGDIHTIGLAIGEPTCIKDGSTMKKMINGGGFNTPDISIGGQINVGGNAHNAGTIKIFADGRLNVNKDFVNTGVIVVNDPEKMKEMLVEMVKTSGTVAELGINILQKFFRINN